MCNWAGHRKPARVGCTNLSKVFAVRQLTLLVLLVSLTAACGSNTNTENEPARCGDATRDEGEGCDDGNDVDIDGCRNDCTVPVCGDGILDNDEACDDANGVDEDACRNDCSLPDCGDGVLDPLEECDEGAENGDEPDAPCRANCRAARCGDGIVDAALAEVCDDGNRTAGDGCAPDCMSREVCGNGVVDTGEECDDGNFLSNDGCASDCVREAPRWRQVVLTDKAPIGDVLGQVFDANRGQLIRFTHRGTYVLEPRGWRFATSDSPIHGYAGSACVNDVGNGTVVCYVWDRAAQHATTRIWDGVEWTTPDSTNAPPPRVTGSLAYDPVRERVILWGGFSGDPTLGLSETYYDDTWEWDGEAWTAITTATRPGAYMGELTYDPVRGETILVAQQAVEGPVDETWVYDGTDWTQTEVDVSTVDHDWQAEYWNGREYATTSPAVPPSPPPRPYGSAAYFPPTGEMMLVGGGTNDGIAPRATAAQPFETWLYGSEGWSAGPASPLGLRPGLAYDPSRDQMLLLGGGTHLWDGTTWTESVSNFAVDANASVAWDANLGAIVQVGGKDGLFVFGGPGDPAPPTFIEGMRKWTGSAWEALDVPDLPQERWLAHAVWDAAKDRVALVGGIGIPRNTCCEVLEQTWWFDGAAWSPGMSQTPQGRIWDTVTYDPHRGTILGFGGHRQVTNPLGVWSHAIFEWRENDGWTFLSGDGPAMEFPAAAFHALLRRTIAYGAQGETWEFGFGPVREQCTTGLDGDDDGLAGCDDPDCWGYCNPECPPGATCPADAARCGDGVCNEALESARICPQDCESTPVCGDFLCFDGETPASCPGDCG